MELELRCLRAIEVLSKLQEEAYIDGVKDQFRWDDYKRLSGKIEGIKLALSYIKEESLNGF